jgi:tRNA U34 5-methylaminomethyl-2-thiouridine-forming methyltransferase MnmC
LERRLIQTADGSATLQLPDWQEQYHSLHGALQESRYVYLQQGLQAFENRSISLLEIGFGTGLNALLTYFEAIKIGLKIQYTGLERYPLIQKEWEALNYGSLLSELEAQKVFHALHQARWDELVVLAPHFSLRKCNLDFRKFHEVRRYDLIYYDAFGARVQPELWTESLFQNMFAALNPGGCLVTYAAKGSVRRAMQLAGFRVQRLKGPPGKREMLRAWRDA